MLEARGKSSCRERGIMRLCRMCVFAAFAPLLLWSSCDLIKPTRSRTAWQTITMAMQMYRGAYNEFPYDSRGADYALYALKEMVYEPSASLEGERLTPSYRGSGQTRKVVARWNDAAHRLDDSPFDYLNAAPEAFDKGGDNLVILSYTPASWDIRRGIPVYCNKPWRVSGNQMSPWGLYCSWVHPKRMPGLPMEQLRELSRYAAKWGVYAGKAPPPGML